MTKGVGFLPESEFRPQTLGQHSTSSKQTLRQAGRQQARCRPARLWQRHRSGPASPGKPRGERGRHLPRPPPRSGDRHPRACSPRGTRAGTPPHTHTYTPAESLPPPAAGSPQRRREARTRCPAPRAPRSRRARAAPLRAASHQGCRGPPPARPGLLSVSTGSRRAPHPAPRASAHRLPMPGAT